MSNDYVYFSSQVIHFSVKLFKWKRFFRFSLKFQVIEIFSTRLFIVSTSSPQTDLLTVSALLCILQCAIYYWMNERLMKLTSWTLHTTCDDVGTRFRDDVCFYCRFTRSTKSCCARARYIFISGRRYVSIFLFAVIIMSLTF